ncbi:MAG: CHAT domain-containing protein, partial [Bacteroidota bacterium]
MPRILFLFFSLLLLIGCQQQERIEDGTSMASQVAHYETKMQQFIAQEEPDSLRYYGQQVGRWYQQKDDLYGYALHYIKLSDALLGITGKVEDKLVFLDSILQLPSKVRPPISSEERLKFIGWQVQKARLVAEQQPLQADLHYQLAFGLLRELQATPEATADYNSYLINQLMMPLAERMKNTGKPQVARAVYNYALAFARTPEHRDVLFNQIALSFKVQGNLEQSVAYLRDSMSGHNGLLDALRSTNWMQIDLDKDQLAAIIPRVKNAIDTFQSIQHPVKELEQWISISYKLLAQVHHLKAHQAINRSVDICANMQNSSSKNWAQLQTAKEHCKAAEKELQLASDYLSKALSRTIPRRIRAKVLVDSAQQALFQLNLQDQWEAIAELEWNAEQYRQQLPASLRKKEKLFLQSLTTLNQALQILLPNEAPLNLLESPRLTALYAENSFLEIFQAKAELLRIAADTNMHVAPQAISSTHFPQLQPHQRYLHAALENYQRFAYVNRQLWNDLSFQQAVSQMEEVYNNDISQKAVQLAYQLYQETGQQRYLQWCFDFAERSKNLDLLQVVKKFKIEQELPQLEVLLAKEKSIKQQLSAHLSTQFMEGKNSDTDPPALQQQLIEVYAQIRKLAPAYHQLLYADQPISIVTIQKLLPQDQALVTYFQTKEQLYIFYITREKCQLRREEITLEELEKWRGAWRESIYGRFIPCDDLQNASYTNFRARGLELAKKLTAFIDDQTIRRLCIIPDKHTQNIPFDLLPQNILTPENAEEFSSYNHFPFLLEKYAISINYSVALWQELQKKSAVQKPQKGKQAYFFYTPQAQAVQVPDYLKAPRPCSAEVDEMLAPLKRHPALQQALQNYQFKEFPNQKSSLYHHLSDCNICHIYTHGQFNDQHPERSMLAMHSEDDYLTTDEILFAHELYAFPQNPNLDLLVLEGCNTGVEAYAQGKGSFSLARAFFKIGARSVATSLWTVNQEGSNQLIAHFYKELKKGYPKDIALQKAKLSMLHQSQ